ncbi:unnamed protein product, partial [Allacma fusca]
IHLIALCRLRSNPPSTIPLIVRVTVPAGKTFLINLIRRFFLYNNMKGLARKSTRSFIVKFTWILGISVIFYIDKCHGEEFRGKLLFL